MPIAPIQADVELKRTGGDAFNSAVELFKAISPSVSEWKGGGILTYFFFQRKPPDLKLRFIGDAQALASKIEYRLASAEGRRVINRYSFSPYEPECRKFGGKGAMQCVHKLWDADSAAWIALHTSGIKLPPIHYVSQSKHVLNDLFFQTLGDRAEVWDTWCNLLQIYSLNGPLKESSDCLEGIDYLPDPATAKAYEIANAEFAECIDKVVGAGELKVGLRAILPHAAMHHLNRYGIGRNQTITLARSMAESLCPHNGLRGRQV